MKLQSINPYTEEVMKEFDYSKTDDVLTTLKRLKENKGWANLDIKDRAGAVKKVARILERDKKENAKLISMEMGKPIKESISEIERSVQVCDYFAEIAEKFLQDEILGTEYSKSYIAMQPLGMILGVMPWNFPFHQVIRFAIPTILAGNTIAVKHSSNVPQCALKIEDAFNEGLPENVYSNLFIESTDVGKLIESDYVDGVSLTGSVAAGASAAKVAGENVKKTVLELGGSDPFIVLDDADLNKCCDSATFARFRNCGQACAASKRFIVQKGVYNDFLESFVDNIKKLRLGNPLDEATDIGPLARGDLRDNLDKAVKKSVGMGAKILVGGKTKQGKGFFYEPTVITNINESMPVFREEMFGPVAIVIPVEAEDDAIRMANNTEYGLGSSLWTRDLVKAEKLAKRIDSGMVFINTNLRSEPKLPFGGVKKSGYGRELSYLALREFVNMKTVVVR
ncbi:MAG: NAD-dependent succinate-semialdehyde dehydrogenase [Candidatus Aenigmarchaeota archaeon]|nr:NAD-dependent succinate-semialdehyde dehydrogenase [Candidatus Aenigmarchaeota archaeon]